MMNDRNKLSWWVPMRHQVQQAKRDIPMVFPRVVLFRVIIAAVAIFLAAAYLLPQLFPGLEFDWLQAFLKCMALLAVILAMCCALAFVPPLVMITPKGIVISQGQHCRCYPYGELAELRIEAEASCPMLLLRSRSQRESHQYPISARIDLAELQALIDKHRPK
jgi:hypothetical protein